MSEIYSFLKECGAFFVITDNNGVPAGRPFDSLLELQNELVIGVSKNRDIYRQLKRNSRIQIVALNKTLDRWIRINGFALEDNDSDLDKELIASSEFIQRNIDKQQELGVFKIELLDYKIYK